MATQRPKVGLPHAKKEERRGESRGLRRGRRGGATGEGASPKRPKGDANERVAVMLEGLRASGLKMTPQRLAIVRELAADPTHPTAQELFDRLRPLLPTMSFATVYNTLDALAAAGLCAALSLAPGASRFDPNMGAHHHAVCDRCGLVRDVEIEADEVERGRSSTAALVEPEMAPKRAVGPKPRMRRREEHRPPEKHPRTLPAVTLPSEPGFEVRTVERIYRGICASCARASTA